MENKILIVVGANSRFAKHFIPFLEQKTNIGEVILFSANPISQCRAYNDRNKCLSVVYENSQDLLCKLLVALNSHKDEEKIVIFTGTASNSNLYEKNNVLFNSISASLALAVASSFQCKVNYYLMGSSLIFVPFLNRGLYKKVKKLEFGLFQILSSRISNIHYFAVPPIQPAKSRLANFFSISMEHLVDVATDEILTTKDKKRLVVFGNTAHLCVAKILMFFRK